MGTNPKKLIFLAAAAILGGCSAEIEFLPGEARGSKEFQGALKGGREPAAALSLSGGSYALLGANVVTSRLDQASGYPSSISYNPEGMPVIEEIHLAEYALSFLDEQQDLAAFSSRDLLAAPKARVKDFKGNIVYTFDRLHKGIKVVGGFIQFVFSPKGEGYYLREILNRGYGEIDLPVTSALTKLDVDLAAKSGIPQLAMKSSEPVIHVALGADGLYQYSYATKHLAEDPLSAEEFTITTSNDGELLEAYSHIQSAAHTMYGKVVERSYILNQTVEVPLGFAGFNEKEADASGVVDVTAGAEVEVKLAGDNSRGNVVDAGNKQRWVRFNVKVDGGDKTVIDPGKELMPALNTFVALNDIAAYASRFISPSEVSFLTTGVTATVNIASACNAYYTNATVNFYAEGSKGGMRCGNTALINDVIYHEWGHGLDDYTGTRRGITDGAFSEGIGDIIAVYRTGDHSLSPGFDLGSTEGIRNLKNTKRYPNDRVGEVHEDGLMIGGAFWDMRAGLVERYGPEGGADLAAKLFFNHLLTTDRYTDSYENVIRLDDDDDNPSTRSPNHCLITQSFADHGLADNPGSDCVDVVMPFDDNLKLAIRSQNDGIITVWAAAVGAAEVAICVGPRSSCYKNKKLDVRLQKSHTTPGGVDIYSSGSQLKVENGSVITMFALNSSGEITGGREVRFSSWTAAP